jgi:hypothetical protein
MRAVQNESIPTSCKDINEIVMTNLAESLQEGLVSVCPAYACTPRTVCPGLCRGPRGTAGTRCSRGALRVSVGGGTV